MADGGRSSTTDQWETFRFATASLARSRKPSQPTPSVSGSRHTKIPHIAPYLGSRQRLPLSQHQGLTNNTWVRCVGRPVGQNRERLAGGTELLRAKSGEGKQRWDTGILRTRGRKSAVLYRTGTSRPSHVSSAVIRHGSPITKRPGGQKATKKPSARTVKLCYFSVTDGSSPLGLRDICGLAGFYSVFD